MPAIPNKLFDVRNGNGVTDTDSTVYNRAELIVFKDNAAKNKVEDAVATYTGWQATVPDGKGGQVPNPVSKAQNLNKYITKILRDVVKATSANAAANAAIAIANSASESELPPE